MGAGLRKPCAALSAGVVVLEPVAHTADGFDERKIRAIWAVEADFDSFDTNIDHIGLWVEVNFPNVLEQFFARKKLSW